MQEYAVLPTDYLPKAKTSDSTKAFFSGTGKKLTDPQAALHRSLYLDKLNHGTQGLMQISPAYWASKAWVKRPMGLTGRDDSRGWASVFGLKKEWSVNDADLFSSDMRHMQSPVYLASLLGLIDTLSGAEEEEEV